MSYWPVYQVGMTVVVPYVLKMEGAYRTEVKPFRRLNANDPDLASKLEDVFSSENMKVVRNEVPSDEVSDKEFLSILNARSWKDLYRKCKNWDVSRHEARFKIRRFKASPFGRGMEPDQGATDQIEKEMSLDRVIAFFVEELRTTQ